MKTFTKWFLLNAIFLTAVFFAETKGAITLMIKNDVSYLTVVIMTLYIIVSAFVGRLSYLADKIVERKERQAKRFLSRRAELGWFASDFCLFLEL